MSFTDTAPQSETIGDIDQEPKPLSVEQAYTAYSSALIHYVSRFRGVDDPEAIVMDVFEAALKQVAKKGEGIVLEKSWYYRVAHNTAINYQRKASTRLEEPVDFTSEKIINESDPSSGLAFQHIEFQNTWDHVKGLLNNGPESRVRFVARHALDKMPYKEIGDESGTTAGSVGSSLSRAYSILKEDEHLRALYEGREVA